jgi:hypothetical protein
MSSPDEPGQEPIEEVGDLLADVGDETEALKAFAQKILALKEGEEPSDEMIQEGITALTRIYTVKFQIGERWSPFTDNRAMPPTAVMIMSTAMLRAVNLELFELGMWQAWSGA